MKKKLISILLILVFLMAMVPMVTLADSNDVEGAKLASRSITHDIGNRGGGEVITNPLVIVTW